MTDGFKGFNIPPEAVRSLQRSLAAVTNPIAEQLRRSMLDAMRPNLGWMDDLSRSIAQAARVNDLLEPLRNTIASQLSDWLPGIVTSLQGAIPTNLRDVQSDWDIDDLRRLMLDEGLPIAWVPRASVLDRVLAAQSPQARRGIYGQSWKQIVDDCDALLARADSIEMEPYLYFVFKAIEGLRGGHHELAQAMIMNTFDTVLQHRFPRGKKLFTKSDQPLDTDELTIREYFAACSIWSLHHRYYPHKGDPIPRTLNRHASVHGVSRRQYTRINAVLALSHLAGLLWFLDSQFSQGRRLGHDS